MCGSGGIISKKPINQSLIGDMSKTLIHRGPDFTGFYFDELAGFFHNRLSLLDLTENGNQPYVDEEHVLLYNGEIYNHLELRHLYLKDIHFKSSSDTETLFYLLKRIGIEKTALIIEGMYAFTFYNRKTNELYLVRDKLGIKPMFYCHLNGEFIFSSELKALINHFDLQLNKSKILSAALGEFEYSRIHTPYENVWQLEPGHLLKFDIHNSKIVNQPYFKLTDWVSENEFNRMNSKSNKELQEEFEQHFDGSVKKMLLSDVPVGAFVSGGIDSSIIVSSAKKHTNLRLYTANNVGKYSELKYSQLLADHVNLPLNIHTHQPQDFITNLVESIWYYELPIAVHPSAVPFQGVASLAKYDGTKPILTGEGSDELFLGYPRLLTKKFDNLIRLPFLLTENIYKKIPGLTRYLNLNKINYNRDLLYLPYNMERNLNNKQYDQAYDFISNKSLKNEYCLTIEMLGRSLHSLLWRNDRMGMMHSLEARFPFLDDTLIKFSLNLPINMKIGKTNKFYNYKHPFLIDKYIVRKYAEKTLPHSLTYRKKAGFPSFGLIHTEVKENFFKNGFLANLLEWDEKTTKTFEKETDKYLLSKLAILEIWGKLFVNKEDKISVKEKVNRNLIINS
jgi:asparagine synthase (glutamine-hydrolysing)